ncbi:hypothetical protein AK812_SmicGene14896 [Symbiodinium microadriaticum]|uniref:Uncharacterized protein n=1 Tax=Symbiodinium microadriaticum TaxID=2951 RepID=A0A1Q9E4D1_SYMMI|nr:hypothetical protein AK812_SmicGene14896 [Symbiodinium microadriaticum]
MENLYEAQQGSPGHRGAPYQEGRCGGAYAPQALGGELSNEVHVRHDLSTEMYSSDRVKDHLKELLEKLLQQTWLLNSHEEQLGKDGGDSGLLNSHEEQLGKDVKLFRRRGSQAFRWKLPLAVQGCCIVAKHGQAS